MLVSLRICGGAMLSSAFFSKFMSSVNACLFVFKVWGGGCCRSRAVSKLRSSVMRVCFLRIRGDDVVDCVLFRSEGRR